MSDRFYNLVWHLGHPVFWMSSRPRVIGGEVTRRAGPFIVAATHTSPYDIPLLMRHCARPIDFVSITEVFQNPWVAWLYGSMNAFPLDRSRRDPATVRTILHRLAAGRVIGMFPEGGFRRGEQSVVQSCRIKPGIGRIATLANVPVIPCVIDQSIAYARVSSWLPIRRVRYGIAFGEPILPDRSPDLLEARLIDTFVQLHGQLIAAGASGISR
ncbi:MAG: lysophospholipid acyltransferase family protein [Tepidisphaeraceae bacterium]